MRSSTRSAVRVGVAGSIRRGNLQVCQSDRQSAADRRDHRPRFFAHCGDRWSRDVRCPHVHSLARHPTRGARRGRSAGLLQPRPDAKHRAALCAVDRQVEQLLAMRPSVVDTAGAFGERPHRLRPVHNVAFILSTSPMDRLRRRRGFSTRCAGQWSIGGRGTSTVPAVSL
jgi:hypothetical protein